MWIVVSNHIQDHFALIHSYAYDVGVYVNTKYEHTLTHTLKTNTMPNIHTHFFFLQINSIRSALVPAQTAAAQ